MQPEGMQKGRETLHDEEDGDRQDGEDGKDDEDPNEPSPAPKAEADVHHHGPEHLGQLCGSKWDILSHQVCMYPSFSSITSNAKAPLRATQELASIRVRGLPTRGHRQILCGTLITRESTQLELSTAAKGIKPG